MKILLRKIVPLLICIVLCLLLSSASASAASTAPVPVSTVRIPNSVTIIEDESFFGCTGMYVAEIPEGVKRIGNHAFANSTLEYLILPASLEYIGEGAFDNAPIRTVSAPAGSYAEAWAIERGLLFPEAPPIDFTYVVSDGLCTITGFTGRGGEVVIPRSIQGYPVKTIDPVAFRNRSGITKVTIPDSVTSIGRDAFYGCTGLKSVTIPDNASIGAGAFTSCYRLTSVTIPDSVTSIGAYAFHFCTGLKSAGPIGSGCDYQFGWTTEIPNYAFSGCSGLTSVTIPDSVTSIGEGAFSGCSGLKSVTIPDSVTSIDEGAFYGCSGLTSVTIPDNVTYIGINAFSGCSGLKSVTIPDSVTFIGSQAFYGCSGLTSLTIPDSVTFIGGRAFYGTVITTAGSYAERWAKQNGLKITYIDNTETEQNTFKMVAFFEEWNPESDQMVFKNNNLLYYADASIRTQMPELLGKYVYIQYTSKAGMIGYFVESIQTVVSKIGRGESVTTSLNPDDGLPYLEIITIDGVQYQVEPNTIMYWSTYYDIAAPMLYHLSKEGRVVGLSILDEQIDDYTFAIKENECILVGCKESIMYAFIPETFENCPVTGIGPMAFSDCTNLAAVSIPYGVLEISDGAFRNCSNLTSVTIPHSVTAIDTFAFQNCTSLRSIHIPSSVKRLAENAFEGCPNLIVIYDPIDQNIGEWSTEQGPVYLGLGQQFTPRVTFENIQSGKDYSYTLASSDPQTVFAYRHNIRMLKEGVANITVTAGGEQKSFKVCSRLKIADITGGSDFGFDGQKYHFTLAFNNTAFVSINTVASLSLGEASIPGKASWRVDSPVISCDQSGAIKAEDCGSANITVDVPIGDQTMTVVCEVTVPPQPITKFTLDTDCCNLGLAERTNVYPVFLKGERGYISYQSSNPAVASVSNGTVTGVAAGETVITARSDSGASASLTVYVYGDGFRNPYTQGTVFSDTAEKVMNPLTKSFKILDEQGQAAEKETEDYLVDRIKITLGMAANAPNYAKEAFYKQFTAVISSDEPIPSSYTNCKTDYELTNRIVAEIADGMGNQKEGFFTFTAYEGKVAHAYICTYKKIGGVLGAYYYEGTIVDEFNNSFIWGTTTVNETTIEAEMKYLKEYSDLKVKEAKQELLKDSVALLDFGVIADWIGSSVKEDILNQIEKKSPGLRQFLEKLETNLEALNDLKEQDKNIRNSFNPKGKNPDSVIKSVVNFNKKIEAVSADLDTLLG